MAIQFSIQNRRQFFLNCLSDLTTQIIFDAKINVILSNLGVIYL